MEIDIGLKDKQILKVHNSDDPLIVAKEFCYINGLPN